MIFESHFGSSAPQFIQNTTPNDPPSKTIVPHQAKIVKLKSNSSRACKPTKTSSAVVDLLVFGKEAYNLFFHNIKTIRPCSSTISMTSSSTSTRQQAAQAAALAAHAAFMKNANRRTKRTVERVVGAQNRIRKSVDDIYRCLGPLYFRRAYRMSYSSFASLFNIVQQFNFNNII